MYCFISIFQPVNVFSAHGPVLIKLTSIFEFIFSFSKFETSKRNVYVYNARIVYTALVFTVGVMNFAKKKSKQSGASADKYIQVPR